MAGHSKWANIRFRKGAQDAKRGKLFTKLIREITISARSAGGDPASNPRLRAAIDKALAANMTKDTVERAIARGTGDGAGESLQEIRYEGYGPGGVALMIDAATDNRNRTVGEVRHLLSKYGGNLGTDGSVAYLFQRRGWMQFGEVANKDDFELAVIESGAEDFEVLSSSMCVWTAAEELNAVRATLKAKGYDSDQVEWVMQASTEVCISEQILAEKFLKLIEGLENLDDVQVVHHNATLADDVEEALLAGS